MRLTSDEFSILKMYYENEINEMAARLDRVKHNRNELYDGDLIEEQATRIDKEIARLEDRIKELKESSTEL